MKTRTDLILRPKAGPKGPMRNRSEFVKRTFVGRSKIRGGIAAMQQPRHPPTAKCLAEAASARDILPQRDRSALYFASSLNLAEAGSTWSK